MTPETIERLPAVDFFFLDNLYHLAHDTAATPRIAIPCKGCGARFLPLL